MSSLIGIREVKEAFFRICSTCKIGRLSVLSDAKLRANAAVVIKQVVENVYGGAVNIRTLGLSHRSLPMIPLYESEGLMHFSFYQKTLHICSESKHAQRSHSATPQQTSLSVVESALNKGCYRGAEWRE